MSAIALPARLPPHPLSADGLDWNPPSWITRTDVRTPWRREIPCGTVRGLRLVLEGEPRHARRRDDRRRRLEDLADEADADVPPGIAT